MVENMSSATADALGLSRAILCNDSLVKKLEELERTEFMYSGLIDHTRRMLRAYFDVFLVYKGKTYLDGAFDMDHRMLDRDVQVQIFQNITQFWTA